MKLSLKNTAGNAYLVRNSLFHLPFGRTASFAQEGMSVELHHTIFETLPGSTWINIGSVILGAVYFLHICLDFRLVFRLDAQFSIVEIGK